MPRSSPTLESADREPVPFKTYGDENKLHSVTATVFNAGATPQINGYNSPSSTRVPMTSTPVTSTELTSTVPTVTGVSGNRRNSNPMVSQSRSNYYTPVEYRSRPDSIHQSANSRLPSTEDSSFYNSSYQVSGLVWVYSHLVPACNLACVHIYECM